MWGDPPGNMPLAGCIVNSSCPPGRIPGTSWNILEACMPLSTVASMIIFYWGLEVLCFVSQSFSTSVAVFECSKAEIHLKWDFFFPFEARVQMGLLLIFLLPPGKNLSFHSKRKRKKNHS